MNIKRIIKNQYFYSIITKIMIVAVGFLHSMLLARYLGAELKGITATIVNYANIFSIIITFGLHEAYPYFRKKINDDNFVSKYMSTIIIIYLSYLSIVLIGIIIFWNNLKIVMCLIITVVQCYATIVNYVALVESPNHRNSSITVINIIGVIILAILYKFTNANLLIGCIVSMFTFIGEAIYFTTSIKFSFNIKYINFKFIKELVTFGFFPMIALLLTTLNYRIDIIMLGYYPQVTYAQIGVYSIGVSLAEKVFLIPNAVKEILLSKLANGKDDKEVAKVTSICWPICLLATIMILLLGKNFINLFYGMEYTDSFSITVICMIGTIFMVFFKMITTYNIVNGKQKLSTRLLAISVIINILMNIVLIPKWGTVGAAIASDISYFICAVLFVVSFCKSQNIPIRNLIFISKKDFLEVKKQFKKRIKILVKNKL